MLVHKAQASGLMVHFGAKKMELVLDDNLFWPKRRRDLEKHVLHCVTCHRVSANENVRISMH